MKEIRLHGRGGQGVVKASQIVVKAAVAGESMASLFRFRGRTKRLPGIWLFENLR